MPTAPKWCIVNWDIREAMAEAVIEIILQAAKEKYPDARPRIISDNGPQFIAKDFTPWRVDRLARLERPGWIKGRT